MFFVSSQILCVPFLVGGRIPDEDPLANLVQHSFRLFPSTKTSSGMCVKVHASCDWCGFWTSQPMGGLSCPHRTQEVERGSVSRKTVGRTQKQSVDTEADGCM